MSDAKRHFKLTFKVRYRTERKVRHTLERPGIWPFNKKKREGTTTTLLECDDCVIRVAEANLTDVLKMMSEDPALRRLMGFFSDAMIGGVDFGEDWDDTTWLNIPPMEGEFIHDGFEGYSEDYCLWNTDEVREKYFEDLRDWDEEAIEPARRIMNYEDSLDDGEIETPWKITDSAPWGGWASGVFYAAFPTILIDDVELLEIRSVTEGDNSPSANQSEAVISLEEFMRLR